MYCNLCKESEGFICSALIFYGSFYECNGLLFQQPSPLPLLASLYQLPSLVRRATCHPTISPWNKQMQVPAHYHHRGC